MTALTYSFRGEKLNRKTSVKSFDPTVSLTGSLTSEDGNRLGEADCALGADTDINSARIGLILQLRVALMKTQ